MNNKDTLEPLFNELRELDSSSPFIDCVDSGDEIYEQNEENITFVKNDTKPNDSILFIDIGTITYRYWENE